MIAYSQCQTSLCTAMTAEWVVPRNPILSSTVDYLVIYSVPLKYAVLLLFWSNPIAVITIFVLIFL